MKSLSRRLFRHIRAVPSPCFLVDDGALKRNLDILDSIQRRTGCRILLALKGFAMFSLFPIIRRHLRGIAASSLHEARLGFEEFKGEVHVYAPAYKESEFTELLSYANHITFNSFAQWERFKPLIRKAKSEVRCGIRINPEHSEVKVALYNPCARYSRLGVTPDQFRSDLLEGITGLHFHTLCELNADALERTLAAVERKFRLFIPAMTWMNFGGGHHITRPDYDIDRLCRTITCFQKRYPADIYLEPGEAVALNTGVLIATVLDIIRNKMNIAILDTSAAAHMPDVLEMPYRPVIVGAGKPGDYPYTYRLGGLTCLAGDIIGDYSFKKPLKAGSRLVFLDMAHYSMVKTTLFNGVQHPAIAIYRSQADRVEIVRQFYYEDYKNRLS